MICKSPTLPKSTSMLDWAKYYLEKVLSLIPLKGKVPDADVLPQENDEKGELKPMWKPFQKRRPGQEELQKWFGNGSKRNIGIVTGEISGIDIVDIDSEKGMQCFMDMKLPDTPMVKTAKGYHAYYKHKEGVKNSQGCDDLPDIHIRGDGGYGVAPPSIHPSGAQYVWVDSKSLDDLPLADFPEIISTKIQGDKKMITHKSA